MTAKEVAHSASERTVFGWQLEVIGDRAKYFACTAVDACSSRAVEVAAKLVVATKAVSRTQPTLADGSLGDEVDVLQLTIARDIETTRGGAASDARGLVIR